MVARRPHLRDRRNRGVRPDAARARDRRRARLLLSAGAALATAALAAAALAGCGGGHSATRAQVLTRGNAICAGTLSRIRAVAPPTGTTPAALAGYLRRVSPIVDAEARSIEMLPRPSARRATLEAFVAEVKRAASAYDAAGAAARRGDAEGVATALAGLRGNRAAVLARRYGLRECTGTVGTVGR